MTDQPTDGVPRVPRYLFQEPGCILPLALACAGLLLACRSPKADEWNPRPAILEQAFEAHPKLDATDLFWRVELTAPVEIWVVEGPYLHGWLVTSWTVDREQQTVHMDWSRMEKLR